MLRYRTSVMPGSSCARVGRSVKLVIPRGTGGIVGRRLTPEPERELPVDPAAWVRDQLDEFLWSKQREIMASIVANRFTAVQSCHGIGKSYVAGRAVAWWIAGHPSGEAMVVTSAPSGDQLKIVWGEIGTAHRRGDLAGEINKAPEWTLNEARVAFGRKPPDRVNAEEARTFFQGVHARYLLVILDEAGGIPRWLWQAALTLVTNEASRILAIGNPDDPTTEFAVKCAPGSGYNVIAISAFDTPNFTGEHVPEQLRESLVGPTYVADAEREWGIDSPLYISKVLGQFPEVADDVIISPKLVREARERDRSGHAIVDRGKYGMDVAEMGEDECAVYRCRGGEIRLVDTWRKVDVDMSRAKAQAILDLDKGNVAMTVDKVGLGAGVWAPLKNAGYKVNGFSGGESANDADRFTNRNAEAWWAFREGMEAGLIDLDPDDDVLAAQLQSRKWKLDSSQRRIRIETKDEMKKRGIKSPDRADAAIMAYYAGVRTVDDAQTVLKRQTNEPTTISGDLLTLKT